MTRASVISRAPLFGKYKIVKVRYCTSGQISPDPSGVFYVAQTLRANAPASPNPIAPSDVPEGWNLISPLYNKAVCLGSKLNLTFLPGNPIHSGVMYVEKSNEALNLLPSPNLNQLLANRYIRYKYYGSGRGNSSHLRITYPFSTKSWFSVKDVRDDPSLASFTAPATLPLHRAYWNFGYQHTHSITGLGVADRIDFVAVVDYIVLFKEPVNVP